MLGELGLEEMSPHPIPALSESNLTYSSTSTSASKNPRRTIEDFKDSKYEDTVVLTKDLKNAAEKCQLLAERLQKKGEMKLRANEARVESQSSHESANGGNEKLANKDDKNEEMEEKVKATTEENIRLRQMLKDVSDINKRWQKYNREQQEYVQKLATENQKLQEENAQMAVKAIYRTGESSRQNNQPEATPARKTPKPLTFRHSDSSLIDNHSVVAALRQSYENAVKENCRLEKELEEMKEREALRANEMTRSHEEQLGLLDCQLKIHKEDWEAEKAEKEEERKKNQKLQEDLHQLQLKCRKYLERLNLIEQTCRCSSIDSEYSLNEPHHNNLRSLRRHQSFSPVRNGRRASFVCDGPSRAAPEQMFVTMESDVASNALGGLNNVSPKNSIPVLGRHEDSFQLVDLRSTVNATANGPQISLTKESVVCPGCLKQFAPEKHLNFLDHFEECQTDRN